MCVFVCALCLYPAIPGWGVRCGNVCLGSEFGLRPAIPGWVVCLRALPVPRQSWLGFVVPLSELGFWFTPGQSLQVFWGVCVCVRAALVPPPIRGWRVWSGVVCSGSGFGCPRHSWLGCWGVCVCVHALPVPRQSWPGLVVRVSELGFWLLGRQCW